MPILCPNSWTCTTEPLPSRPLSRSYQLPWSHQSGFEPEPPELVGAPDHRCTVTCWPPPTNVHFTRIGKMQQPPGHAQVSPRWQPTRCSFHLRSQVLSISAFQRFLATRSFLPVL